MSYICLFANENGISAAGDSRIALQPVGLGLHFDRGRKVFSDEAQGMVWACCGLVAFGGIHYPTVAAQILRDTDHSLAWKLERIAAIAGPATKLNRRLYRKDCSFILLVGRMAEGKPDVRSLSVVNGEATVQRHNAPVLLEGGWRRRLYPSCPSAEAFAGERVEKLNQRAVRRVREVIALDHARHLEERRWPQTVGGSVCCVYTERR